jgi:hypothetical protein
MNGESSAPPPTGPRVEVSVDTGTTIVVTFEGVMREANPSEWFMPLIDSVHSKAVARGVLEVALDIRRVEYANAAAWKCLVYWLRAMREDPQARYCLCIRCDEAHQWQQIGMPALRAFGGHRLIVEIYDKNQLLRTSGTSLAVSAKVR